MPLPVRLTSVEEVASIDEESHRQSFKFLTLCCKRYGCPRCRDSDPVWVWRRTMLSRTLVHLEVIFIEVLEYCDRFDILWKYLAECLSVGYKYSQLVPNL